MGYYLQAFICQQTDATIFTENFDAAKEIRLGQGLSLIPMTAELFDQINDLTASDSVSTFERLTQHVETMILLLKPKGKIAYVEAEYFGGEGGQLAITWNNQQRESLFEFGHHSINEVLKSFGVRPAIGSDEFDTLNLGRHRNTSRWIEDQAKKNFPIK